MPDQETEAQHAAIKHIGDVIAKGESYGGDYGAWNAGTYKDGQGKSHIDHQGKGRDMSNLTVDQVISAGRDNKNPHDANRVFASGKYQITAGTLLDAKQRGGIDGNARYTNAEQDEIFEKFLLGPKKTPHAYTYIRAGEGTMDQAMWDVANEWRSVEVPNGMHRLGAPQTSDGRYCMDDGNAAREDSGTQIAAAVEAARVAFGGKGSASQLTAPASPHPRKGKQRTLRTTKPEPANQEPRTTQAPQPLEPKRAEPKDAEGYRGYELTGSVGRRGENHHDDVLAVQTRLAFFGIYTAADGTYGPSTQHAIDAFQKPFGIHDGLIEVGKKTAKEVFSGEVTVSASITGVAGSTTPSPRTESQTQQAPAQPSLTASSNSSLDELVAQDRLTTFEVAHARGLIAGLPAAERARYYTALQAKTAYVNERTSKSKNADGTMADKPGKGGMCNLSSLAMCCEYLGIPNPHPEMLYQDALERVRVENHYGARTEADGGWAKVAEKVGAHHQFLAQDGAHPRAWWHGTVGVTLAAGKSVMVSIGGHIVRIQAVTEAGVVVDDPFGHSKMLAGAGKKAHSWKQGINTETTSKGEDITWDWEGVEPHVFHWICAFARN
ncbi:hypothetical protein BH11MYX1_BH11MYX1_39500 [soil metagenome]